MLKPLSLLNYSFSAQDNIVLDANVWMMIYGPYTSSNPRNIDYSNAFKAMLQCSCKIWIDILIISEFINACARFHWKLYGSSSSNKSLNFKQYRNSTHFPTVAQDISADIRKILNLCSKTESVLNSCILDDVITEYSVGNSDFNDLMLTELCKFNNYLFVTDDSDFQGSAIQVISANPKLI